jgi:CHAD domain-containing protein
MINFNVRRQQLMSARETKQATDIKASMMQYITGSLELLSQKPIPDDKAIHDVRVMMKQHRAAVRLARPLIDEPVYRREYLAGRETGRMMATWREAAVLRKTVKALKKENPELFMKLWDNEKIQELLRKPFKNWDEAARQAETVKEVSSRLDKARYRVRFLGLSEPDVQLLLGELERHYHAAAASYMTCRKDPGPRLLHEFRKKSKTFMYQLCYFRHLNPSAVKSLEKKLDYMTQNLGKYNDLSQVKALTGCKLGAGGNSEVIDELAIVIRDKQDTYLMKVWPVAYRIYAPGRKLQDLLGLSF